MLSATGCTSRGQPVVAVDVLLTRGAGGPDAAADAIESSVRSLMGPALDELPGFALRPARGEEVPHQVQVRVELVSERPSVEPDRMHRAVGLRVRLAALDATRAFEVVADGLASADVPPAAGFAPVVASALDEAMERLTVALELESARPSDVVAALSSEDDAIRQLAMRAAAERRLVEAVEPLAALLNRDDLPASVVMDIVGALVAIGDPRGAEPVIERFDEASPEHWPSLLFALAQIGGRKAQGFLFTVAKGHDDARVRALAEEALRELEQSRERPTSAQEPRR